MKHSHSSTKQKIYALVAIAFVTTMILFLVQSDDQVAADIALDVSAAEAKIPTLLSDEKNIPTVAVEAAENTQHDFCKNNPNHINCEKLNPSEKVKIVGENSAKNEAWKVDDVRSPTPSIPLSDRVVDYEIVEIEQHPEHLPQIGEQITLPMLNGQHVVVDVQSISTSANGDQTWSGHLQGHGTDYPVIMTYGEHAIFAMITTPEGSYSMESVDGLGWLYKNPSELELSSTNADDFLEVNEVL